MKIKDVIKQLQKVENKEMELFVCDEQGNNLEISSIDLYDIYEEHSENNPLGVNFK